MSPNAASSTANTVPSAVPRWQLLGAFLIIYVVWGSTYLAIKWGVQTIPPFFMGAVRFLIAGSALYAFTRWRGAAKPTRAEWRDSAIVGTLLLFVGNGAVSWASQRVNSGLTSVLVATVPLWLVLCEAYQGKRPRVMQVVGVLIGLVGVGLLVLPAASSAASAAGRTAAVDPMGAAVLALGSLSWTVGSLYSRTAHQAKPAALAISMQMLTGGTLLSVLSLVMGEWSRVHPSTVSLTSLLSLLYLITFGSLIGFSTYMWLLKVASPAAVGTYAYVNPLVAVLLGVALGGERLPRMAWVAMTVIVGGVALVSLVDARRKAIAS
ncbi:drug/metabolite exporter YedA [Gemmatimonas phototrophica]|uniref:drug/metabolite exporter YedA n=1 Tax=Gemmatimonas phototrophica TaxID=1379270 RepID=UPI001313F7C6|nr:drug/metabolite exporter YedA [Gemmatimonas phototrophica]